MLDVIIGRHAWNCQFQFPKTQATIAKLVMTRTVQSDEPSMFSKTDLKTQIYLIFLP